MISTQLLIKSINDQRKNRFISKYVPWGNFTENVVRMDIPLEKNQIVKLFTLIRKEETNFLTKIVKSHSSLHSFLKDRRINPAPSLAPQHVSFPDNFSVSFTIECLPVKGRNPLKNRLILPELGEVACLIHFDTLSKIIQKHFNIKTQFKLLVESSAYGKLFGIDSKIIGRFNKNLLKLSKKIITDNNIKLVDWATELNRLNDFNEIFNQQKDFILHKIKQRNKKIIDELLTIFPTIYMDIKPKSDTSVFTDFSEITPQISKHAAMAETITINIMAFNRARKICNERKLLFPNDLRGTLTPAKNKWAFYPIGPWNKLYPHHGVGLFNKLLNRVVVYYTQDAQKNISSNANFIWYTHRALRFT